MTSPLYKSILLDHARAPRNKGSLEGATLIHEGFNPNCGDKVRLGLFLTDHTIDQIRYDIRACAVCTASVSIMTEQLIGTTVQDAQLMIQQLHEALLDQADWPTGCEIFSDIAKSVNRHRCIALGWDACRAALEQPRS